MDQMIIAEETARVSAAVTLSMGAHSNLFLNQIVRNGTEEQKQKFLPAVIESVAMQLRTCELTLTACMAVSHTLQCAADKHSGDCALTLKQSVAQ